MRQRTIRDYVTFNIKGEEVKFPSILVSLLGIAKRRVDQKLDNVWLVSGMVGSGKSTIAQGIAGIYQMLFNRELSMDNFTWKAEGVVEFTDNSKNETQVIIQDEGIVGMTGRDSITKTGQQLKITLVTKRRMKIFYIILIDELHEYSQKVISRATLLIDTRFVMSNGDPQRGYFKIYNQDEIKEAYWLLKEKRIKSIQEYKAAAKNFYKFWNYEGVFVNEKEYEQKKIEETSQADMQKGISWKKEKIQALALRVKGLTYPEIAERLDLNASTVKNWGTDFKKVVGLGLI